MLMLKTNTGNLIYDGTIIVLNELVSKLPLGAKIAGKLVLHLIQLEKVKPDPNDETLNYLKNMQKDLDIIKTKLEQVIDLVKKIEIATILRECLEKAKAFNQVTDEYIALLVQLNDYGFAHGENDPTYLTNLDEFCEMIQTYKSDNNFSFNVSHYHLQLIALGDQIISKYSSQGSKSVIEIYDDLSFKSHAFYHETFKERKDFQSFLYNIFVQGAIVDILRINYYANSNKTSELAKMILEKERAVLLEKMSTIAKIVAAFEVKEFDVPIYPHSISWGWFSTISNPVYRLDQYGLSTHISGEWGYGINSNTWSKEIIDFLISHCKLNNLKLKDYLKTVGFANMDVDDPNTRGIIFKSYTEQTTYPGYPGEYTDYYLSYYDWDFTLHTNEWVYRSYRNQPHRNTRATFLVAYGF